MSTNGWTNPFVEEKSPSSSQQQQEPRRSAPPIMQQPPPQAEEEVVWDDSMMDVDYFHETMPLAAPDPAPDPAVQELRPADIDPSQVRYEAVHIRGVDNLSTNDIQLYASTLYPSFEFKIEWIDDTSLNLVYESPEIATSALQALSLVHIEQLPASTLRPAKPLTGEKSIEGLKARIAFIGDKKERGARDRSRWYLFNPHPSEEYDRRRDSRRRGERRYDPYPRRRRSRSKSPPLNYDDHPTNEGVELFPSKVSNSRQRDQMESDSWSRSAERRRRFEGSRPAFSNLVQTVSSTDQPKRPSRLTETMDLFPDKIGNVKRAAMDSTQGGTPRNISSISMSLEDRISTGEEKTFLDVSRNRAELFPDKVQKPLDERISGKSLTERIQDDSEGGARELFPDLLRRSGGGRRRRKAEDHF